MWFGQPSWTITMGLSGCASFQAVAIWAPISKETAASSLRAVGMPVSAIGLKNDVMMTPASRASLTPGVAASASQMCSVAPSKPPAMTWSMFWVMTAESAWPSKTTTSAPYFSGA